VVVVRHMLPNAALPMLTVAGLNLGQLIGGAIIVETVFNWPGVGSLMVDAVQARDFPVALACLLTVSIAFVLINLMVDAAYVAIDPRVRLS
jgi:ABC-type dipeptide/oligopeptide/nickel transport system permease component